MNKYIKFVGDFKILKPMGFKFGKYFSMNRKGYTKRTEGYDWLSDMHIWVLGRDITIGSMDTIQSLYLAKHIINGTYLVHTKEEIEEYHKLGEKTPFKVGDSKTNMLNRNTGEITDYIDLLEKYGVFEALKNKQKLDERHNYNKDGWNRCCLSKGSIELIKEFNDKGLIEFVEE